MAFLDKLYSKKRRDDEDEERQYDTVSSSSKSISRFEKRLKEERANGTLNYDDVEKRTNPYTHHESYNPYPDGWAVLNQSTPTTPKNTYETAMYAKTLENYLKPKRMSDGVSFEGYDPKNLTGTNTKKPFVNTYNDPKSRMNLQLEPGKDLNDIEPHSYLAGNEYSKYPTELLEKAEDYYKYPGYYMAEQAAKETAARMDEKTSNLGEAFQLSGQNYLENFYNNTNKEDYALKDDNNIPWWMVPDALHNPSNPLYYKKQQYENTMENLNEADKIRDAINSRYFNSVYNAEDFDDLKSYNPDGTYSDDVKNIATMLNNGSYKNLGNQYAYIRPDEIDVFNYLLNKDGEERAMEYLDLLNLKGRRTESISDLLSADAYERKGIASMAAHAVNALSGITGTVGNFANYIAGNEIDPDAWYNLPYYATTAMRGGAAQRIKDDNILGMGDVDAYLYQVGTSMEDFVFNLASGNEALALGIMGATATESTIIEAKERGLSDGQALTLGAIAGAAEVISEKVSIEALFNSDAQGVKYILQNGLSEGGEEVESDLINDIADMFISGDKAQMRQEYQNYLNEGLSESQAFVNVVKNRAGQYMLDFAGGAISGAAMGGMGAFSKYANQTNIGNTMLSSQENLNQFVNLGLQSENEETRTLAQNVADGNKKKSIIGQLVQNVSSENNLYGRIVDTLRENGETQGMAEAEAESVMRHITGQELNAQDQEYLQKENVQNALNDVFGGTYDTAYANSEAANDAYSRALEMARQQRSEKMAPVTNAINNVRNIFGNKKSGAQNNTETENNAQVSEENTQKAEETETQEAVKNIPLSVRAKMGAEVSKYKTDTKQVNATLDDIKSAIVTDDGLRVSLGNGEVVNTSQIENGVVRDLLMNAEKMINDSEAVNQFVRDYNANNNVSVYSYSKAAEIMINNARMGVSEDQAIAKLRESADFLIDSGKIPMSMLHNMYNYGIKLQKEVSAAMNSETNREVTKLIREALTGIKIKEGDIKEQGSYNPVTNEITLGKDTNQSQIETITHEGTHLIKEHAPEVYKELEDVVLTSFKENGTYQKFFDHVKKLYGENASEELIHEEMVARAMQEMLFNEDVIMDICKNKPHLGRRIWNAIKKAIAELQNVFGATERGTAESRALAEDIAALEKAKKLYAKGLKEATSIKVEETSKNEDVKYSIKELPDGRKYVDVDTDQNIFEGYDRSEYPRIAKEYMRDHFQGRVVGKKGRAFLNATGKGEYAHPRVPIEEDYIYDSKMKAATELDNLVDAGTFIGNEPDGKDGHFHEDNEGGFNYYDILYKVDGYFFKGLTNIELKKYGKLFKDITKIEDVTKAIFGSKTNGSSTSSNDIISEDAENINDKELKSLKDLSDTQLETDYNQALKDENMDLAAQIVEQYAANKGFTQRVYHGTPRFGFTKLDTSFSDDKLTFFTTDKPAVASSYSGNTLIRDVGEINKYSDEQLKELVGDFEKIDANDIDKKYDYIKTVAEAFKKDVLLEKEFLRDDYGKYLDFANEILEQINNHNVDTDILKTINTLAEKGEEDHEWGSYGIRDIYEHANKLKTVVNKLIANNVDGYIIKSSDNFYTKNEFGYFLNRTDSGIYSLYANTDNMLEVDAEGNNWASIFYKEEKYTTRQLARVAAEEGYAGVIIKNVYDNGGRIYVENEDTMASNLYVFFNPQEQCKSADVVTYDDKGKVIPLSERFEKNNNDIRYSIKDNTGAELSEGQQEYFKDSVVRDAEGNLLRMYHGTPNGDFTVFKGGSYFTDMPWYADIYQGQGASMLSYKKNADNPKTYAVYLNITKPFDTRIPEVKKIWDEQFYRQWGTGTPLQENGLPDWTDAEDILEFIEENELDFDGVVVNEGGIPDENGGVKSRGDSWIPVNGREQVKSVDNLNPTDNEDIRFSMKEPVEVTKDLIAAHNISEENLLKTLKLGGFPMPSIAVTKAEYNPDNFGTISVLFDKNSIDPKVNKANKGYFGDAWTPTVPRTVKKINNKKLNALHDKLGLSGDYSSVFQNDMEDIVRRLFNEEQVKEKFIKDNNVEIEKKPYTNWHHPRTAQIFDILKDSTHTMYSIWTDEALKKQLAEAAYPESKLSFVKKAREKYLEMLNHIDDSSEKLDEFMKDKDDVYVSTYMNLYQDLFDIVHDQVRSGWDRNAYRDDVNKYISEHEEEFKKFIEDAINEADMYEGEYFRKPGVDEITNNGRRSFEQLHIPYNAENMLKLMLKDKNAIKGFFGGASNLRGAITKEYKSIEDIKQNEGKLNKVQAEEVDAKLSELNHIILEIDSAIKDANGWSGWVADDDINETLVKLLKKPKITLDVANSVFAKDETKFAPEILDEVIELKKGLQELPVQYFEAKPERVLGFDEIKATIIPDDSSVELKEALDKAGIPYEEYKAGDKEDRLEKLNSHEDLKFSLQDDWDYDWESAMAESEEEKIAEGMVAQNDVNILEDGFRALKDIKDAGKVNISHNKAVQIAKRYTEKYDSATGAESLATSIEAVFAYIREHDVSYDDMLRVMRDVTLPVVENIRGDEQFTEEYRDFVKSLKGTSISLNESQKKEVAYAYGSMANFRKAVAGRFNIKEDGVNIDSLWPEIVEQSGYRLDEEENSNSQPIALLELLDQMKSDKGTVNRGMSDNQLALDMALNIYTDCFKEMSMNAAKVNETEVARRLEETKKILKDTVDKYEDAVDKMYKKMLADTKAQAQAEIDRLNQELRELNNIDTYNRSIDIDKRIVQLKRQKERLEKEIEEGKVRRQTSRQKARENRENSRMRNAIKRIVKDLSSRLANPTKNKYIPEELVKTTVDMLECINFDTKEGDNIKEKVKKVKDAYEKLGKSTNENDASDDFDPALYNMITRLKEIFDDGKEGKSVRKLSQKELEDVLTIAKAIQIQVKNANELIRSEIAQQLDETAKGVIDDVRATRKIGNKKFQHWLNSYVNTQLNASRFFNRLVGYNEDSKMIKLFDELNEGQHKMMQIQMETSDIFKDILTDDDEARKITGENEKDWVETPFKDKNGNPIKISKGMRLSLAMHMENEDNLKHIIYGGLTVPDMKLYNQGRRAEAYESSETEIRLIDDKTRLKLFELRDEANNLNDEKYTNQEREEAWEKYKDVVKRAETEARQKLQSIVNGMTDYEKQFLEYAKKYFWEYSGKQINETSMALNGYPKAMVENYFPIATDKNYTKRDIEGLKLDQTLESWGNLKERVHGRNPIYLENILDVISKHSNMVSKYAGLAIPIRNFNRVYNFSLKENGAYKDSVKKAINSQRGISATKYIKNLLTDLQGSRNVDTGLAGDLLSFFRGNYAAAALTMNYGVTIKQASSLPTAAAVIGKDAIKHAIISRQGAALGRTIVLPFWMSKTTKNKMDLIKKYSPLVWYRNQGNSTQELGDLKKQRTLLDFTKPTKKFKELTSNWIQNVDTTTVVTLWNAAEYRVSKDNPELKKGSEEYYKEVAKWFNKTVEDTQPNYTTLQRPDILRNPNEVVKAFSMFKTQSYQNGGLIKDSFGNMMAKEINYKNNPTTENKTKLKKAQTRFANTVAAIFTAQMLFSVMGFIALCIISKPNRYRDENGELTAESITKGIMRDFGSAISGSFLFGSEIYDGFNAIFSGGKYYGIELANLNQISTFIEDGVNLLRSGNDIEKIEKNAFKVINDVSYLAGVPLKNATNLINGVKLHAQDIINGDFFEAGYTRSNTVNQNRLYEAMISGDNDKFDDVYAEMLQNGLTPDKIYGTSGSAGMMVKEDLLSGKYDVNQAIDYLEKLGMDEESATEKAYGFLTSDIGDMSAYDQVEYLEGFGVSEEDAYEELSSKLTTELKTQVTEGSISVDKAMSELENMGYTEGDAYIKVMKWASGYSNSDYAGAIYGIENRDTEEIIRAVNMLKESGKSTETLQKHGFDDQFKEQYIDLYHTNKTEAASLKSAILTYYQACGMSREDAAKKVDKWVE